MSSILIEFTILCQQINENFHLNQILQYQQLNAQQNSWSVISASSNSSVSIYDFMNIDVAHAQYVSVRSDE